VPHLDDIALVQKSGMLIILDPRDECFNENMQCWKHCSELANKKDGACLTMMFRVLKVSAPVCRSTACGVNPKVVLGGKKQKSFDALRKKLAGETLAAAECKHQCAVVLAKIQERLAHH